MKDVHAVLLVGARGRMGKAVAAATDREPGLTIDAELVKRRSHRSEDNGDCDVVIDFSTADATEAVCSRVRPSTARGSSSERPGTVPSQQRN